jgi:hypothetical protein
VANGEAGGGDAGEKKMSYAWLAGFAGCALLIFSGVGF